MFAISGNDETITGSYFSCCEVALLLVSCAAVVVSVGILDTGRFHTHRMRLTLAAAPVAPLSCHPSTSPCLLTTLHLSSILFGALEKAVDSNWLAPLILRTEHVPSLKFVPSLILSSSVCVSLMLHFFSDTSLLPPNINHTYDCW